MMNMRKAPRWLFLTFAFILSAQTSDAGSATWNLNPSSGDWNTAANWTPALVPNGPGSVATFALSNTTDVSLSVNTEVNGIAFNPGASAFTIIASPRLILTISGFGIANNSGVVQDFMTTIDGNGQTGTINFTNNATAGNSTSFTNEGGMLVGAPGTATNFSNNSNAGSATITNNGGTFVNAQGGITNFAGAATAANATIFNRGGMAGGARNGSTFFFGNSNAGTAQILNDTGVPDTPGGLTEFFDSSVAGSASFINNASGATYFANSSSANSSAFTNNPGAASVGQGGATFFLDTATASTGIFTNVANTVSGVGAGYTQFSVNATAGDANFVNVGSAVSGAESGLTVFINDSTVGAGVFTNDGGQVGGGNGGSTQFRDTSRAGGGTFLNHGGAVNGANGGITFFDANASAENGTFTNDAGMVSGANGGVTVFFVKTTASNGTITNNGGAVSGAYGGLTYFAGTSNAGLATFANNGGSVSGAFGGTTEFHGSSSANNSTLTASGGAGEGGSIFFWDDSTANFARAILLDNGYLNVSHHNPNGLTIGSIEGNGVVFLGATILSAGDNNLDTTFSGTIQDGGAGGTFVKVGSGILTFEGGPDNDHIADTVTIEANGIINLNYTGPPDTVAGLIVDSVPQPPGVYGSAASGAPNPLPIFAGLGTVRVVTPTVTPPVITSPLVATATVGQLFVYQIEATGATFLDVANPPPGLQFGLPLRAIAGTPDTPGTFQVGLNASNSQGTTSATLIVTVQPPPPGGPIIASGTAATGRVGQPLLFRVYTTGGSPAGQLTVSGLPPGLVTNAVPGLTGLISGRPTLEGSSSVDLTVMDGQFTVNGTLQLTFTADPARPVITSPTLVSVVPGEFFSYSITASSSTGAFDPPTFAIVGNLPPGLTFNTLTGTISGTYSASQPNLAGGTLLGSVQLFATNGQGTSTLPLTFLQQSAGVVNLSTRLQVGTGENVLIGGFIVQGNAPKVVIIRAIGPSTGIPGALQDTTLELHDSANHVVTNDNWKQTQEDIIEATTIPPGNDLESAIVIGLDPGNYTAIVAGKNATTGIGLVEVYDLGTASLDLSGVARLAQISTRGFVDTGNNVMIGGFIIRASATNIIARGIGPSLAQFGIANALSDPTLELRNGSGSLLAANNNWQDDPKQAAQLTAAGLAPISPLESGIASLLPPGPYTAIVSGNSGTTGVGLVEVYALE